MKYKIGDKVRVKSLEWYKNHKDKYGVIDITDEISFEPYMLKFCGNILTIKYIYADKYAYGVEENGYYWTDDMIEENVEEISLKGKFGLWENKINSILFSNENYADKVALCLGDDYEIVVEDGRTFVQKKKPKYPKTYEECCKVLGVAYVYTDIMGVTSKEHYLYSSFFELIRCRDAYWKIAGDWKYDVNKTEEYFYIVNKRGSVVKEHFMNFNYILAFPTEEMRDAFYENFKDLIEKCKELL